MEAISRYSSGLCALPPTGPTAQIVGAPTAAVKPLSAQPPLNSPRPESPLSCAASTYISNSRAAAGVWVSGRNSPRIVSVARVPGTWDFATIPWIFPITSSRSAGST